MSRNLCLEHDQLLTLLKKCREQGDKGELDTLAPPFHLNPYDGCHVVE